MKLFDIPLKLIQDYSLTDETSYRQTVADVRKWEGESSMEDASPLQKKYAQLHSSPIIKLLFPILYIFVRKSFNDIMNPQDDAYERRTLD